VPTQSAIANDPIPEMAQPAAEFHPRIRVGIDDLQGTEQRRVINLQLGTK
jgi:hypothetical protein